MRIVLIALMIAVLAVPAHARGKRGAGSQQQQSSAEQKQKALKEEKDYKSALDRIPDQKAADPWSKVR
jgi:hypothetical protein